MKVDTLKERLADIDADTLQNFVLDLYLRYPELSDKIEALTLTNDPVALSSVLRKRVSSLKLFALVSLWGNRMDLSIWPEGGEGRMPGMAPEDEGAEDMYCFRCTDGDEVSDPFRNCQSSVSPGHLRES